MNSLTQQTTSYQLLLQECREIIVEHEFMSHWTLIEGYHALGKRIIEDKVDTVTVTQLSKDLNRNERTIQRAIQFARKYPDLNTLPEGKNTSWHKIVNKYLPETTEKKETHKCNVCGGNLEASCHTKLDEN